MAKDQLQLHSFGFGKLNYAGVSASYSAFVIEEPFSRTIPSGKFARHGAVQSFPASAYPKVNGSMYIDTVAVPDGQIVLLQGSIKMKGTPFCDAAIPLLLRSNGPLLAIKATMPSSTESLLTGEFLVYQGRANLIAWDELSDMGIAPSRQWRESFTDEEEVDEMYSIDTLMPELVSRAAVEVVTTAEGGKVAIEGRRVRRFVNRKGR